MAYHYVPFAMWLQNVFFGQVEITTRNVCYFTSVGMILAEGGQANNVLFAAGLR